jgi:PAS domain S-box-containing protein
VTRHQQKPQRDPIVLFLGGLAIGIAALDILGWCLGVAAWGGWVAARPRMVPTTALSIMLLGVGVACGAPARDGSRAYRWMILASSATTLLIAGSAAVAYALRSSLGPERLFLYDLTEVGALYRGRMSPQTAGALVCVALALTLTVSSPPRRRAAQVLGSITALVAVTALGGHIYGVVKLFGVSNVTGMALPTAVALLVLAGGIAALQPEFGIRALLSHEGPAGRHARHLVLAALLIPFGTALLLRGGELLGWYDANFRAGAYLAFTVALLVAAACAATVSLFREEAEREKLDAERSARQMSEAVSRQLREQIGERERAEQALAEREARLAVTLRSIGDAVIATDGDERVSVLNRVAEELTGWTIEEAVGRPLREVFNIINEDTHQPAVNPVDRVLREGIVVGLANHTALVARDGTARPIADSAAPIRDPDGRVSGAVLVFRDQTEERRAEKALRESEQRFRLALRNAPVSVAAQDRDLRYVWAYNQKTAPPEGIVGKRDEEIFTPDEAARIGAIKRRVLAENVEHREQMWLDRPSGRIFLDLYFEPIRDGEGRVVGVGSATVDLTRSKLAEDALRKSEENARARAVQLQAVLDCIADGVLVYDREGRIVRSTPAADRLLQLPPGEREAPVVERVTRQYEIFTEDGCRVEPEDMVAVRAAVRGEKVSGTIQQVRSGRSEPRWLMISGMPLIVEGVQTGAVLSMTDLTERKRAEQELAIVTRLYAVLSRVNEVIVRTRDEQALYESVCRIVAEEGGFPLVWVGLVSGRNVWPAASCGGATEYLRDVRVEVDGELGQGPTGTAVREDRPVINDDFDVNPATGPWRLATARYGLRASAAFPLHRGGSVIGALTFYAANAGAFTSKQVDLIKALCADVSYALDAMQHERHRAEAEQALRESEQCLREADRHKDEFLGMLSHELRNPLAPIRNSVYILRQAKPGSEQAQHARTVIERQAEHLTRLVEDLLDVTRIARGKIELRRTRIDLREVVRRAADDFRQLLRERGIALRTTLPPEDVWADADATRIAQVIGNLFHNSAKFVRGGGEVAISLRAVGARAEISVQDTGTGIDPALLPRIFDAFVQGERTLERADGGLGLGLALVKGITELHGGAVAAGSEGRGKGAEFVVSLPTVEPEAAHEAPRAASSGAGQRRRVLVVDDNRDAADSLAELVELLGHAAEVAYDGPSALATARANAPDVVLCDIGLPGMSGYDVAKALRATVMRNVLLVALTGYARPEDQRAATEAGFDRHLAKPASPAEIEELLASRAPMPA